MNKNLLDYLLLKLIWTNVGHSNVIARYRSDVDVGACWHWREEVDIDLCWLMFVFHVREEAMFETRL